MAKDKIKIDWDRTEDITIEEVKATEVMKHFTDEQAKEFINLIKVYCQCIYALHKRDVDGEIDLEAKIIELDNNEELKIAA